ncbi:MAG: pilus assembly PilX family protein [Thalassotalea sp.]
MFLNVNQPHRINSLARQQGSALVIAVFIIIVMTLLGTALIRMLSTEAEAVAYEVIGTRAFQAAQSGMQWQLQQVFPLNSTGIACPSANSTQDYENIGNDAKGLQHCMATLSCQSFVHTDGVRYYQLESVGQCEVAEIITSRKLLVDARSL